MKKHFMCFFNTFLLFWQTVIIVYFILNSNRREIKSDGVHGLLSHTKTFIEWCVLTNRIAPCCALQSKFYTNEIPLSLFSQLFNLCLQMSKINTNLNISKRNGGDKNSNCQQAHSGGNFPFYSGFDKDTHLAGLTSL